MKKLSTTSSEPPELLLATGSTVREQYDSLKQQADQKGRESLFFTLRSEAEAYAEKLALEPFETERILSQYDRIIEYLRQDPGLAEPNINAMLRYFLEGKILDYESNTSPLLYLREQRILQAGQSMLDFGAGPGASVDLWNRCNSNDSLAEGIDLSMSFVMTRAKMMSLGLIDAPWEDLQKQSEVQAESFDLSMSNLTLDRVRNPNQLIKNLINATRKNGAIAIGTLLPIVPEDDGQDVAERIIYTPQNLRIVPGEDLETDKSRLRELIEDTLQAKVTVDNVPIEMSCSDGVQNYPNFYVFSAKKN